MIIVVLFIMAKFTIYFFWCRYGIHLLAPARRNATAVALGLACVRVLVGFALGLLWAYSIPAIAPNTEYSRLGFDPLIFIIGFLVLRLLLWSGISVLIRIGTGRLSPLGVGMADWLWRLGGVGISFIGDIAAVAGWIGIIGVIC